MYIIWLTLCRKCECECECECERECECECDCEVEEEMSARVSCKCEFLIKLGHYFMAFHFAPEDIIHCHTYIHTHSNEIHNVAALIVYLCSGVSFTCFGP